MLIDAVDLGRKVPCKTLLKALKEAAIVENGQFVSNEYDAKSGKKFLVLDSSSSGFWREEKRDVVIVARPVVKIPFLQYRDKFFQSECVCIRFEVKEEYFLKGDSSYKTLSLNLEDDYSELGISVWIEGKITSFAKKIRISLVCVPIIGWIILLSPDFAPGGVFSKERYFHYFSSGKQNELEKQIEEFLKRYLNSVNELLENKNSGERQ